MSPYTPLQQDRQARNRTTHKDATARGGSERRSRSQPAPLSVTGESSSSRAAPGSVFETDETFEERERRHHAARVVESNEMLIWYANQRNESVPQTRLYFEKIVAGLESDSSPAEWEDDNDPDSDDERLAEHLKRRRSGKSRSTSGQASTSWSGPSEEQTEGGKAKETEEMSD